MKTLTLRLSETDYVSLQAVAAAERLPMSTYLMRLFDKHAPRKAIAKTDPVSLAASPKSKPRDDDDIEVPDFED